MSGRTNTQSQEASAPALKGAFFAPVLGQMRQMGQKIVFLKNEAERLLITQDRGQKTNRNEPKNEAEKLLKTLEGLKNEAKNEAGHVVENKRG